MAGAKSRSETGRLEHWLRDQQVQRVAMVGRGPQSQDWYNSAKKETETREKPTSFNARCSLQPAEHRQELNSRSHLLGNKLKTGWPPSGTALLAVDGKAGKGACSWEKPTLSLQTHQAAGSGVGRMMLRGQEGKSAVEAAAEKGSFFHGVTYTKEREKACSWSKNREQRGSEKIGDVDLPERKQGGKVSQQVAAIQQGKAQWKRGPASASSPLVLEPVKPLPRGSLAVHHATRQSTKPTNWMYLGRTEGCILSAAELPLKEKEVCGSLSTPNEGDTIPAMTDGKPELTIATPATAGEKHHIGERMNSPQPICVTGEPETRNTTSMELKHGAEGVDPPECEAEHEAPCGSGVSGTPYVVSGSLEPEGLSTSSEIAELVNEKSKGNTKEFPGKQIPVTSGETMQPSTVSDLPGIESNGEEFEKTEEVKLVSMSGFLEEPSPEQTSQENKEKRKVSSPGLPEMTGDHSVSCPQETEHQTTCDPLKNNLHEDILRHDVKSPGKDFPVSADTSPKGTCAILPSHNEVNNSKLKDPREVLSGNIFHISEQSTKSLDSSKLNISLDKSRGHPVGEEKVDLKLPGKSSVHTSRPDAQSKETRNSQACRETLGKGFRIGKNPFTTLFGSEEKAITLKKETTTQRKPTKPQSALVTLFGYSSEKKQSQPENPARSSKQTNIEDRQEKPQGLLRSSSQAKQKASKNNQLPQPGKTEVTPEYIQESSGSCSDSTEGKETDVLLLGPGANISWVDEHERTELDIHDQLALNSQAQQQQDICWPSLTPAQKNHKEAAVTSEGGINPLHPPPELMPAADSSKNLIREGNHRDAHLPEIQNLLSLDAQDTVIEPGIFFSPGNSEKLPKEVELQLDNMDFPEDDNLFFSGGQDFPITASKIPNSDLQNSEAETPPCFDPNPSELSQETQAETNAPLALRDTSSLSLLVGQDEIITRDLEGNQSCALLQQLDPQYQAPKAAEDTFGLGVSAEGSTNKYFSVEEDDFPPMYMFPMHASEALNRDGFDPFSVDSAKMGQDAPAQMNRRRKMSRLEEAYESFSSADLNVLNDGLLEQEFFI